MTISGSRELITCSEWQSDTCAADLSSFLSLFVTATLEDISADKSFVGNATITGSVHEVKVVVPAVIAMILPLKR